MSRTDNGQDTAPMRIGYVLSRFPKLTETFILFEILELQRQGVDVRVHALVRERTEAMHPEAERLLPAVEFPRARGLLKAQLAWLLRRPSTYARLWATTLLGNLGSPRFLLRGLATVALGAYLAERMRAARVEHVHAHWATHSALAGLVAARLLDVTFSFTAHAHDIYVDRSMLRQKVAAAAFVVTISDFNRHLLEDLYPAETSGKLVVIHCGVDVDAIRPPVHPERTKQALCVVSVASFQPQKGQAVLIQAIAILRDRGIAARLNLVGDGPEAASLRSQVDELHLNDIVEFTGALSRPAVLDQLRNADVMALASIPLANGKMEGIPVALMEGMAMGLPVVATGISGVPELVTDGVTGYLVRPGDATGIADALGRFDADRGTLTRMGTAARASVVAGFNLRDTATALRRRYEMALGRVSAQRGGDRAP